MSEQAAGDEAAPIVHEIKTTAGEKAYRFRSITLLTYATLGFVGLNALTLALAIVALGGRLELLGQIAGGTWTSTTPLAVAAHDSDRYVTAAGVWTVLTMIPAYIAGAFWIYNAACNIRALGARGMQISPGWTVGWFAVPVASLFMPFQGVEEIYNASRSPADWKRAPTPLLLRFWWGAWLLAALVGYVAALAAGELAAAHELGLATELLMLGNGLSAACCGLFMTIVWRVFRAQAYSRVKVQAVARVFA